MNFAAIEIHRSESPHAAVEAFMREAVAQKQNFKHLEVLRTFNFGIWHFAHIKTDCPGLSQICEALRDHRGMIVPIEGRYRIFAKGREAEVPISTMTTLNGAKARVYRGPGVKHWERQFLPMPGPE